MQKMGFTWKPGQLIFRKNLLPIWCVLATPMIGTSVLSRTTRRAKNSFGVVAGVHHRKQNIRTATPLLSSFLDVLCCGSGPQSHVFLADLASLSSFSWLLWVCLKRYQKIQPGYHCPQPMMKLPLVYQYHTGFVHQHPPTVFFDFAA